MIFLNSILNIHIYFCYGKSADNLPWFETQESANCGKLRTYKYSFKKIEETGVDALELNIYILPSDWRRNGEDNEKICYDIIHEVRNYVSLPISVKTRVQFMKLYSGIE